jgi:hypothetical protein
MLSAVLLHVIKTPRPIDYSLNSVRLNRRIRYVNELSILIADIFHRSLIQRTDIVRLPARRCVKTSLIQHNRVAVPNGVLIENAGREIALIRILPEQFLGHLTITK